MANVTRQHFRTFGDNAIKNIVGSRANNYAADPTTVAGNPAGNNPVLIESLSNFINGLKAMSLGDIELLPEEELTALFYRIDEVVKYNARKGIGFLDTDSTCIYDQNDVVMDISISGGKPEIVFYASLQNNNGSKDLNDNSYWSIFYSSNEISEIKMYAGQTIPGGWLICDGSELSRTDYLNLFNAIGTTYGAGDGTTTFNIPDLTDRVPQGASTSNPLGTFKEAGLPNITGSFIPSTGDAARNPSANGAIQYQATANSIGGYSNNDARANFLYTLDASRSSPIYGKSSTVQPPALHINFIIKY